MSLTGFSYKSIDDLQDEIIRSNPLEVPLISKQTFEYMGTPIAEKVEEFDLFLTAKRLINKSKGKGIQDVEI